MAFINPKTNKVYPMPKQAAVERAKAHLAMFATLGRMEEQASGSPAAYLTVIRDEKSRQFRMVNQFRSKYGPNAHV